MSIVSFEVEYFKQITRNEHCIHDDYDQKGVNPLRCLVTGGAGFLGKHLVERLMEEATRVRVIDLPGSSLDELEGEGVEVVQGDIRDAELVASVCRDIDVVFHVAALAAPWGARSLFWSINVTGTDNVISGCLEQKVQRLVHVSSPSAVFDGKDHFMADESISYPKHFLSHYCETKAVSEQHALAANSRELETVVIRPHIIWGPRDRSILPRIVSRARAGRLFQIGNGLNQVSTLYVGNAVEALLLAARSENARGKAYFITNDQPVFLWEFISRILENIGIDGPRGSIPYAAAYLMATGMEATWSMIRLSGEPLLTRYTIAELARNHTYSIDRAKKDLGYAPRISVDDGLQRLFAWIDKHGLPE